MKMINLAIHLCQGLTLEEIAERLSSSKHSLRTQLRSYFNKLGVSRQVKLVTQINTGPAGIFVRKS